VTPVAPRIVNDVSYVTRSKRTSRFRGRCINSGSSSVIFRVRCSTSKFQVSRFVARCLVKFK